MNKSFIAERVYELRSGKDISARKLSLDLGLSNSYILQVESGKKTPSFDVMLLLSDYFGITLAEFFSEDSQTDPDEARLLSAYRQLPEDKQKTVVTMVDALAKE